MSIIYKLESLVHHRYTLKELKKRLKDFDKNFEIYEDECEEYCEDDNFDFDYRLEIACDKGLGTIYYLPTRKGNMYVTEVSFEKGI